MKWCAVFSDAFDEKNQYKFTEWNRSHLFKLDLIMISGGDGNKSHNQKLLLAIKLISSISCQIYQKGNKPSHFYHKRLRSHYKEAVSETNSNFSFGLETFLHSQVWAPRFCLFASMVSRRLTILLFYYVHNHWDYWTDYFKNLSTL